MRTIARMLLALASLGMAGGFAAVAAECQLANPSFEFAGTGTVFAAWNQIDPVASSDNCVAHGQVAARVSGTGPGSWGISGLWQALDAGPGQRWRVTVRAGHDGASPLVGEARGIVNVEWRDATDALISYESQVVVTPSTPPDRMQSFTFETQPAPAGTSTVRIVLAKLQSPGQDAGRVFYDHVQFRSASAPTLDDVQWGDFPGGRTIDFGGYTWRVKGPGVYGPGGSFFGDGPESVSVDASQRLHLAIRNISGTWASSEVALTEPLGYGDYLFTTVGRHDTWAANVVFGFFLWQYPLCYEPANPWNLHAEFDLELSRWGDPTRDLGQFVCQPWDFAGNIDRFAVNYSSDTQRTSFAFRHLPDRVECRAWLGGPHDERPENLVRAWTYSGPHLPLPEQPRIHINLWQLNGPPANGQEHEIVLSDFAFVPACDDSAQRAEPACLAACLAGPGRDALNSCDRFDRDGDSDVDLLDVIELLRP